MERNIESSAVVRAPLPAVCDVLRDDPGVLFPDGTTPQHRLRRRYTTMIAAPVAASATVQHEVEVELGAVTVSADVASIRLTWEPVGDEHLVPSFEGALRLRPDGVGQTEVAIRGTYEIPLGPVGRFGDSVVGRRIARRSVTALVEDIAERLDAEILRRRREAPVRPAPYPPDLRDAPQSEIYLG